MKSQLLELLKKIYIIQTPIQRIGGFFVLILSLLSAFLETLGVSIIVPLVNALLQPSDLLQNAYIREIALKCGFSSADMLVMPVIYLVISVYILKNAYFCFFSWFKNKYACKVQRECSIYMFESYMSRGYSFFLDHNVNELRQGIEFDVGYVYNVLIGFIQIISQVLISLLIFGYLFVSDWQTTLGVTIASVICLVLIILLFNNIMKYSGEQFRKYNIKAGQVLLEALHGIKEVFVMSKEKYFLKEYESNVTKRQRASVIQAIGLETPAYVIEGVCVACIMIVLGYRVQIMDNPQSYVATLAAFAVGIFRILPALGKISNAYNSIITSIPGCDAVYENITAARNLNSEKKDNNEIVSDNLNTTLFANSIELDEIAFSYSDETAPIFSNLNLSIPIGKSIAFIGESGAGKSTLADIILGLLLPQKGKITIDNIDLKYMHKAWSDAIGFVPQSIYLTDSSVRHNVAFGVPESEIDDLAVVEALKGANLYDFIANLPSGVDTFVGDRGVRLSGGQRQRIGIARALYRKPQILVLDEATSALDVDSEQVVMDTIDDLHGSMTIIIIAHRLSTIEKCDLIYRIENGNASLVSYDQIIK